MNDSTERVLQAMVSAPALVGQFIADLGGDPESYGPPGTDWITAEDAELGRAFIEGCVTSMLQHDPRLSSQLADVDLSHVDHSAVGRQVKETIEDPSAWVF